MSNEPIVYSVVIPVYNSAIVLKLLHCRLVAVTGVSLGAPAPGYRQGALRVG